MKPFVVSYDLDKPGQDYSGLVNRLKQHGATRIQYSQWVLRSTWTAMQLLNDLGAYLDSNDRILVVQVAGDWAYRNLMGGQAFKEAAA